MATGMVLIIVSRNIDLSVGSCSGSSATRWPWSRSIWFPTPRPRVNQPYTWIIALVVGVVLGALIGGFQGFIIAYVGVPSFIVTLGGFLVWRGLHLRVRPGPDARADGPDLRSSSAAGRPARSASGRAGSSAALACVGDRLSLLASRRRRRALRLPAPADVGRGDHRASSAAAPCSARSGSPTATPGRPRWPTSTRRRTASPSRRAASRSRPASPSRS